MELGKLEIWRFCYLRSSDKENVSITYLKSSESGGTKR